MPRREPFACPTDEGKEPPQRPAPQRSPFIKPADAAWYAERRHDNERLNEHLLGLDGWYYCDPDSFYAAMFQEGSLQRRGDDHDGRPNVIVVEDTGKDKDLGTDASGNQRTRRVMRRYTVHDGLCELEGLRARSLEENSFMFLSPVSYYGKSRAARNARFLHAIMIDLDDVGIRELDNLVHQMEHGVIPYANYLVSSGTGLHVVYLLEKPVPLMTRYIAGLQVIKRELTDRVWNANTSGIDPKKKQFQGIYQPFRMVGTPTKLNGDYGNPKVKCPYVVTCFSHDSTPPATIPYLVSFLPTLRDKADVDGLAALRGIGRETHATVPIERAKELWPGWYARRVEGAQPRGGWTYGRAAYDRVLSVIREQASVSHRYWCIYYLAVMANKCGVAYEELEADAYGLLHAFDALAKSPVDRFTAKDVAAALEAYEDGGAGGRARRCTQAFCERHAAVSYGEKMGHGSNPPEKRLPREQSLKKARLVRDLKQELAGTTWWNEHGAPTKAMQVWEAASANPGMSVVALAREAGVSRPTVYKWLHDGWQDEYAAALAERRADQAGLSVGDLAVDEVDGELGELGRRIAAEPSAFEAKVLRHIRSFPWESFDLVAARFGLSGDDEVQRILDRNMDYYWGLRYTWDDETDDYFDAINASWIAGRHDEFMEAREVGVQASIAWALRAVPDVFFRLREIRAEGRDPTLEEIKEMRKMDGVYIHSI